MEFTLRPWNLSDAEDLARFLSNEKIMKWLRDGLPNPYTAEDAKSWIGSLLRQKKEAGEEYAIEVNGKAVGTIGYTRGDNICRLSCEIGYYLSEDFWGKGIMTEAVRQLCDHIFADTDIQRVYAEVFEGNIGSCRVLERGEFTLEAVMKKAIIKNGQIMDMNLYARVRP